MSSFKMCHTNKGLTMYTYLGGGIMIKFTSIHVFLDYPLCFPEGVVRAKYLGTSFRTEKGFTLKVWFLYTFIHTRERQQMFHRYSSHCLLLL